MLSVLLPAAVVVWWVSSFFLLGDLGKYSDDWFFSGRDPSTGEALSFRSPMRNGFWRPLHKLLVPGLQRVLWEHDALNHLIGALAHGWAAVLLFSLLTRLGVPVPVAVASSLLFVADPLIYEVVFWSSALSTGVAASLFLVLCHEVVTRAHSGVRRLPLFVVAFAIPCFNEQAAAGVVALPLLFVAARPSRRIGRGDVEGALRVGFASTMAVGLYLATYLATVTRGRGLLGTWTGLDGFGARIAELGSAMAERLFDPTRLHAAMVLGAETVAGAPALLLPPFVLGLVVWLWMRRRPPRIAPSSALRRPWWLSAFGIVWLVADWFPIFLVAGTPVSSRMFYAPSLAVAVVGAALVARAATRVPRRWRNRAGGLVAGSMAVLVVAGMFGLVGYQTLFQRRAEADASLAAALRAALPEPDVGSIFLVLGDRRGLAQTGGVRFEDSLPGALDLPQSATPFVRWTYGRLDLGATRPARWRPEWIRRLTAEGVEIRLTDQGFDFDLAADDDGVVLVPWDRVLPFRITANGAVERAGRLGVTGGPASFAVEQVQRLGIERRLDVGSIGGPVR